MELKARAMTRLVGASLVCAMGGACGPSADRVSPSHRLGLPAWQTLAVEEQDQELRVRVLTRRPEQARGIAARIVRQRRGQGWTAIHVEVRDQVTNGVKTISAHYPYDLDPSAAE